MEELTSSSITAPSKIGITPTRTEFYSTVDLVVCYEIDANRHLPRISRDDTCGSLRAAALHAPLPLIGALLFNLSQIFLGSFRIALHGGGLSA
jgi:hypothetical protein